MNNVSTEMQKDKSFALSCGWTDEQIILDDRDLGVSGQLRMEDRPAFYEMLRRIASDQIKAVVAVNVDRLFRNKWGDESGKFMEICHRYGVIVVTPDFVYDFQISWHIERFKRRCEEAWNYLEYHVYGRLHPAQDERGYAGFWIGGNMPLGYTLDTRERINGLRNPNYYRYIIYEPHAQVIRWIFARFQQLNGNVRSLMREIEKKAVLFPDFNETVDPFIVHAAYNHCTKVEGGYTIVSEKGLRMLLINRVYIGYWVYKRELISTENHPPIVDLDTFTYSYNRLSQVLLDGTPNENAQEGRGKQYRKQHFADRPAYLKECIQAKDPTVKIYTREVNLKNKVRMTYGFFPQGIGRVRGVTSYIIDAEGLDKVVMNRLREHLQSPENEGQFENYTSVEGEVVSEISQTLKAIDRDIEAIKALMARILEQVRLGKFTEPDLADAANESYQKAKEELERLEERKKQTALIAHEDQDRRSYKQLMKDVGEAWEEVVVPDDYPRMVYLFIKSVTLEILSPTYFSLEIKWHDPGWGIDTGVCHRGTYASPYWTEEEVAILIKHYATASRKELTELLPRRNFISIRCYLDDHGINIPHKRRREEGVPYYTCLEDWKVMQQYGITEDKRANCRSVILVTWHCLVP